MVITVVLQLAVVCIPVFNALFNTVPLRLVELAVCIAAALVILAIVELEKRARRRSRAGELS